MEATVSDKLSHFTGVRAFAKTIEAGKATAIQAIPFSSWDHPIYGPIVFDAEIAGTMLNNFSSRVLGQDLPITYEHFGIDAAKGMKAAGWVEGMEIRDGAMWWSIRFTPEAAEEINNEEWKYFSSEWWDVWEHPETGKVYTYVAGGGALTNKPFMPGMVPLNFSQVILEGGNDIKNEVAEKEHSEPGTGAGGEPTPRTDGDPDKGIEQGWRRDTPPIEREDSMEPDAVIAAIRERLGIGDDVDIVEHVVSLNDELAPLRKQAETTLAFSQQYPQEFARMQALETEAQENRAKAFSSNYAIFKDSEGKKLAKGFSALVVEKIEDYHKKFSRGQASMDDLKEVLDTIATGDGIVDYAEHGSSQPGEPVDTNVPTTAQGARKAFSAKVVEIRNGNPDLTLEDAVTKATEQYPELARAYRNLAPTA